MFPYRVKYNESEYDIQINDLFYEIYQQCQNTFDIVDLGGFLQKTIKEKRLFYYVYNFHNSYFVNFVILGFSFCIFIFIYITRVGLIHV